MNGLGLSLAFCDLRFDRSMALTLVIAVAAVLTPLMILLGLKTGIVETARQQLLSDPHNLELVIYQNTQLSHDWFQRIARRPETRFVIPRTRTINASLSLVTGQRKILEGVELLPTQAGDPLFPPSVPEPATFEQVVLSQAVATRLNLAPGDRLDGVLQRRLKGERQQILVPLTVVGILPETAFAREALFVTLAFLEASEDYRDGYQVPMLAVADGEPGKPRQHYASARLYARGLDEVLSLAAALRDQGLEVRTRAAEIDTLRRMQQLLTFVFSVIAAIGSLGGAVALGANVWSNVERKRRDMALLSLMGMGKSQLLLFPVWQALAIASFAFAAAYAAYSLAALIFNRQLQASLPEQAYACVLHPRDLGIMLMATLLVALITSLLAGLRASRIDPAECLREVG